MGGKPACPRLGCPCRPGCKGVFVFSNHFEMTFFPNRVRLTNARTGETIDRTSDQPFSSEHRMVADREAAAKFLNALIRESERDRSWWNLSWPTVDVTIAEGPRTENDRQEVHRLVEERGFRSVRVSCEMDGDAEPAPLGPAHALDAMSAAPDHHSVLLENDQVRILDTRLAPGERTPVHTHEWAGALYVLSWSDFVRRDASGNVMADSRTMASAPKPGDALWLPPLPPHQVENVGDADLHIIAVELKQQPGLG